MAYGALPGNWDTLNESQKNSAAIAAGYTGLNDYNDQINRGKSSPSGNAPMSFGSSFNAQPSFDPVATYQKLMEGSGIKDTQAQIDTITKLAMEKEAAKNQAIAGVNDNPFYSEATRVGRARRIEESANADITTLQNQAVPLANKIAMSKADIETQLGLETQRYNIGQQERQMAQQQFNTLLSSGALDNASGEDIANITRMTGMSSSMIQSAINANKQKNVQTQTIQWDDGTNTGYAIIDANTGDIINRQTISASKPSAAEEKAALGGGGKVSKEEEKATNVKNLTTDVKNKATLKVLINHYSGVLSVDEIYRIYNTYSPWGKAKETLADVKQGKFVV